jgi:hypothetical protein
MSQNYTSITLNTYNDKKWIDDLTENSLKTSSILDNNNNSYNINNVSIYTSKSIRLFYFCSKFY